MVQTTHSWPLGPVLLERRFVGSGKHPEWAWSPHLGLDNKGCFSCTCGHLWLLEGAAARIAVTLEIEDSLQDSWWKRYYSTQLPKQAGIPTHPALFNASSLHVRLISVFIICERRSLVSSLAPSETFEKESRQWYLWKLVTKWTAWCTSRCSVLVTAVVSDSRTGGTIRRLLLLWKGEVCILKCWNL